MDINKTLINKEKEKIKWYLIDAKKYKLGRLSSEIAYILKDKNNPNYLPYKEGNTKVIVINSKHVQLTGKKNKQKKYKRHSGRPGGLKVEIFEKLQQRAPNKIIENAIRGMLPKNSLGRKLFKKIKIYQENTHSHNNENVIELNI